jgi:acetate---CoA ligase (ADP-forming)
MLAACSVAVVGASSRPGSFGEQLMLQLARGGFDGAVYPVNPAYDEVFGRRCLSSLEELPDPVDLVLLGVSNQRLEGQLTAAARSHAGAAVIFASCYETPREDMPSLAQRLVAIASDASMPLCGGNGMGFLNLERGLRACGFRQPQDLHAGPITFITHSGSAFSALLHNDRDLSFNLVVSTGLELNSTIADYLAYSLESPSTRVVALFIETVRDSELFRACLQQAAERDVAVVALKVGRESRAKELVEAHSGALAGDDAAYEALFDAYGVAAVATLDEMADTLELFAGGRRARPGGLAAVHDSGGERAHLIDLASDLHVPFASISDSTRARLRGSLEEGLPAVNPVDAWGTGNDYERIFTECLCALADDPDTAALALVVDLTTQEDPSGDYVAIARRVAGQTDVPFAVMSNLSSAIDRADVASLRSSGIPVLEGTATGLAALRHLFDHRDFRARPPLRPPTVPAELRRRWWERLGRTGPVGGVEALALLADYGVPVVSCELVAEEDDAVAAARRLGWPVALKTAAPGVAHRTDVGGVRLNLRGETELRAAYAELGRRLGPSAVVAAMAPPGVELALGVVHDESFGPLVMVAAGGIFVELLGDRRVALAPVDVGRARALIDGLAARPLLDGFRGAPAVDVGSVAESVAALSVLADDLGERLGALDVNPLIAGPGGCIAADALVVPRPPGPAGRG